MGNLISNTRADILLCQSIIDERDAAEAKKQIEILVNAYDPYIPNMSSGLDYYDCLIDSPTDYLGDIQKIKKKLELFKSSKCQLPNKAKSSGKSLDKPSEKSPVIIYNQNHNSNNNQNTNTNEIEITFKETINQARKEIENNGSLHQEEIEEILAKLNELEDIHDLPENKNKKWAKLKGLLNWVSTKGVDIGIKVLPLIIESMKGAQ